MALEDFAGKGVDGDVGGLADLDVDDVGFVHLDFGGDDAHVGEGHQRGAFGVLDADDHGLAFANGHVGDDAVKGRDEMVLSSVSLLKRVGDLRLKWPRAESVCALAWLSWACSLGDRCDISVVCGLLGVEVLLGHDAVFEEALSAFPIEFLLLEVGLGVVQLASAVFSAAM